jgi:hypothetical protein
LLTFRDAAARHDREEDHEGAVDDDLLERRADCRAVLEVEGKRVINIVLVVLQDGRAEVR